MRLCGPVIVLLSIHVARPPLSVAGAARTRGSNGDDHWNRVWNCAVFVSKKHLLTCSDIESCQLDCLAPTAFNFTGASNVTAVVVQSNDFLALPEELLWNMASLLTLNAASLG